MGECVLAGHPSQTFRSVGLSNALVQTTGDITLGSLPIGSMIKLNYNGTLSDFIVAHHGKPSSIYSNTFADSTILVFNKSIGYISWHTSNSNRYADSSIHSYLNSTCLNSFDSSVRNSIKQVRIPYGTGGESVNSGENGLACKLFLLSVRELDATWSSYYPANDGAKLDYFTSNEKRKINGDRHWTRTPTTNYGDMAYFINGDGNGAAQSVGDTRQEIHPAFVLPDSYSVGKTSVWKQANGSAAIFPEALTEGIHVYGVYTGDGAAAGKSIMVGFRPKAVLIEQCNGYRASNASSSPQGGLVLDGYPLSYSGSQNDAATISATGFDVKGTMNTSGRQFYYIAFK